MVRYPTENGQKQEDRRKRLGRGALFLLVNIAVVAYAALREQSGAAGKTAFSLGAYGALWLLGGFGCLFVSVAAESAKYLLMMRALGTHASVRAAFETTALGRYYDSVTPGGAGGQPFQIWWLRRRGYDDGAAGAMPIVSFITMQAGFIIPAFVTFLIYRAVEVRAIHVTAWLGLAMFSFAPLLLAWFSAAPRTAEKAISVVFRLGGRLHLLKDADSGCKKLLSTLTQYTGSFDALAEKHGLIAALMALSIIYRIALCSIPWFVLEALGVRTAYLGALALTFYIYAASAVIPTPGNAGAAEGSFYLVFSAAGASGVFWAMLLWRVLCYYSVILIGATVQLADAFGKQENKEDAWYGAA